MAEEQAADDTPQTSSDAADGATPEASGQVEPAEPVESVEPVEQSAGDSTDTREVAPGDAPEDAIAEAASTPEAIGVEGPADEESSASEGLDTTSIEELLKQANFEDPSTLSEQPAEADPNDFKLPDFQQVMQDAQVSSIELLRDVDLDVKIELGRSRMLVEDVLKLSEGSVVELDKLAGDPVDVFVNERLVARGEVLVLNDNFCVRINEIMAGVKEEGM